MSEYLNQVIFWVGSAIAALGGTGLSLGLLCKSIVNVVKLLKSNVKDYDDKIQKIKEAEEKLTEIGGTIANLGEQLVNVTKQLEEQKAINDKLAHDYEKIQKLFYIFAHNNSELAECGAVKHIDEILDIKEEEAISEV